MKDVAVRALLMLLLWGVVAAAAGACARAAGDADREERPGAAARSGPVEFGLRFPAPSTGLREALAAAVRPRPDDIRTAYSIEALAERMRARRGGPPLPYRRMDEAVALPEPAPDGTAWNLRLLAWNDPAQAGRLLSGPADPRLGMDGGRVADSVLLGLRLALPPRDRAAPRIEPGRPAAGKAAAAGRARQK